MRLDPITLTQVVEMSKRVCRSALTTQSRSDYPRIADSTLRIGSAARSAQRAVQVMPDDHSEVVPLLPIPNRTVKRLCADDSAASRVKVGHRQAVIARRPVYGRGVFIVLQDPDLGEH